MLREPRKEEEPVPPTVKLPVLDRVKRLTPEAEAMFRRLAEPGRPLMERVEPGVEEPMPTKPLVASTKKMLEMEAVIPEVEATSKNVSGVVSPTPNLPKEVEEKINLVMELSWKLTSLLKVHSPVIVWLALLEAGPLA